MYDILQLNDMLVPELLDIARVTALGWQPRISLREGIERTYAWYLRQHNPKC